MGLFGPYVDEMFMSDKNMLLYFGLESDSNQQLCL